MLSCGIGLTSLIYRRYGAGGAGAVDLLLDEANHQIVDELNHSILGESFDPSYFSSRLYFWDDVSLGNVFQDSTGVILADTAGNPIGKIADKSGKDNHALQTTAGYRPLLQKTGIQYYINHDRSDDVLSISSLNSGTYSAGIATWSGVFTKQLVQKTTGTYSLNQSDTFARVIVQGSLSTNENLELCRWLEIERPVDSDATDVLRVYSNTNSVNLSITESGSSGATWLLGDGQTASGTSCVKTITAPQTVILRATSPANITVVSWGSKSLFGQVDLSKLTGLTSVNFSTNKVSGPLSITTNTLLTTLYGTNNYFCGCLDVSLNTLLTIIQLSGNQFSGNIDVSTNTHLTTVNLSSNQFSTFSGTVVNTLGDCNLSSNLLTQTAVDAVLAAFVTAGKNSGTRLLDLSGTGNAAPSVAGLASVATLQTRGWTVTHN